MLVKKKNRKKIQNSPQCIVWEYDFPSSLSSFATAKIDGRYPEAGRVANLACEEIYYVLSGTGTVHSEHGTFKIKEGDLYFFKKKEKYWVMGKQLFLVLVNAPKFTPEQHKTYKN
jgi:mannose-6-phosphate isomerase-like protein (cupin superfamily)